VVNGNKSPCPGKGGATENAATPCKTGAVADKTYPEAGHPASGTSDGRKVKNV